MVQARTPVEIEDKPTVPQPGVDMEPWDHQAIADWIATRPHLLEGYQGEWVAFAGRRIVAHAPTYGEAVDLAQAAGVDDPLMVPVPPAGDLIL